MDRTATPDTVVWKLSSRVESKKHYVDLAILERINWQWDAMKHRREIKCVEGKENLARKFVSALPLIELYFLEELQELCHACMRISL